MYLVPSLRPTSMLKQVAILAPIAEEVPVRLLENRVQHPSRAEPVAAVRRGRAEFEHNQDTLSLAIMSTKFSSCYAEITTVNRINKTNC
jgi:hypothetical protein